MKVSTKGRYALRMMIDLCENECDGFIPLRDVAQRQEISKKYLEQIIPLFNNTDILLSARGNQGGYRLGRSPRDVSVGEILSIAEGSITPVNCSSHEEKGCRRVDNCPAKNMWMDLDKVISNFLYDVSLQDLLDDQRK